MNLRKIKNGYIPKFVEIPDSIKETADDDGRNYVEPLYYNYKLQKFTPKKLDHTIEVED